MLEYEQIKLIHGTNYVVYDNSERPVDGNTMIFYKNLNNQYIPIGKLNRIGEPGTEYIIHATTKQRIGTEEQLKNKLYAMKRLPSVLPVPPLYPNNYEASQPDMDGGKRRRKKSIKRRRTKKQRLSTKTNKK